MANINISESGRKEAREVAQRIKAADTWNPEDCAALCKLAGLSEEWKEADGDTFESVLYQAADLLGIEII